MITDTEGIVLRQTKTVSGRRMLLLFSRKFGKISVGSATSEGGRSKSALATRPFTYGRYELFKGRDSYNLNNAQVIKSYYSLGENLDKYMAASYVLELTEKLLTEEFPQPGIFRLLLDFMEALESRTKKQDTLVMAYMVKVLDALGTMPELDTCACCGRPAEGRYFSVREGGVICGNCAETFRKTTTNEALIYHANFGIVNILKYFQKEPFAAFQKIALEDEILEQLNIIMRSYITYHFDIGKLKSESIFSQKL